MIQIKIFEGSKEEIQEEINAFLQLSNIDYIDFKILSVTKIMLIYELIECVKNIKWNDRIFHFITNNNKHSENPSN